MKKIFSLIFLAILIAGCSNNESQTSEKLPVDGPIQLHPENQHYFLYKGKTVALITSAEHYGSVLNLSFDYQKYLETLSEAGMNYTRIFTGTYFEIEGESFDIQYNNLAPAKDKRCAPWITVSSDLSGKIKYDLSSWNETYFERLRGFISEAAKHDIIVEVTLFTSIYGDEQWNICPLNPVNNINIKHDVSRLDANTLNNGTLFDYQVSFVRKMINELNEFNNFFFEIQNEPWSDRPVAVYNLVNKEDLDVLDWTYNAHFADKESMQWQEKIAAVIVDEEARLSQKHLIAQCYTNFNAPIPDVAKDISIINFHYAWPGTAEWNYHYNKVLGFDESGFAGSGDQVYRRQAWQFMLSGGGIFNNLDYSFFVGHEDGLGKNNAPGGGGYALRQQLKILSDFLHGFELEKLHPYKSCIVSSPGLIPYVLSDNNNAYAVFLRAIGTKKTTLQLKSDDANYQVWAVNTINGSYSGPVAVKSLEGILTIDIEIPEGELALKILKE